MSDVQITLCWIPAHTGISGNEAADRAVKEVAEMIEVQPNPGPQLQSTAAVNREAVRLLQAKWKKQWAEETEGRHLFKLNPELKKAVLMKHNGLSKAMSAVGIQLQTSKIGLGQFLFERKVSGFSDPECSCKAGNQTVQHVLLACRR